MGKFTTVLPLDVWGVVRDTPLYGENTPSKKVVLLKYLSIPNLYEHFDSIHIYVGGKDEKIDWWYSNQTVNRSKVVRLLQNEAEFIQRVWSKVPVRDASELEGIGLEQAIARRRRWCGALKTNRVEIPIPPAMLQRWKKELL